jgi:hypothetical protein
MRKIFAVIILVFICCITLAAAEKTEKASLDRVLVTQYNAVPGKKYAAWTAPVLQKGIPYFVRYDITTSFKDDKQATIACTIKFPEEVSLEIISYNGIQSLTHYTNKDIDAITLFVKDGFRYCEFLIPQKMDNTSTVEFSIEIPSSYEGSSIQVDLSFNQYRKPFFSGLRPIAAVSGFAVGITVGILASPAVGLAAGAAVSAVATKAIPIAIGVTAGVVAMTGTYTIIKQFEDARISLQEIRNKYKEKELKDSSCRYTWIIEG